MATKSTLNGFDYINLITRESQKITKLLPKMQNIAVKRGLALPEEVHEFKWRLVVAGQYVQALSLGGSSKLAHFPMGTSEIHPQGTHIYLTFMGEVVVDHTTAGSTVTKPLATIDRTYVFNTFSTEDLKNVLKHLTDAYASLLNFRNTEGQPGAIQWVVDHLSQASTRTTL